MTPRPAINLCPNGAGSDDDRPALHVRLANRAQSTQVDYDSVSNSPTGHTAAGSARDEWNARAARPRQECLNVFGVSRHGDGDWDCLLNAGGLGINSARRSIGTKDSPKIRRRLHGRELLTSARAAEWRRLR